MKQSKGIFLVLAMFIPFLTACGSTQVAENEACLQLRMGEVVSDQPLSSGFKLFFISNARCFDMTEQTFPDSEDPITMEKLISSY